MKRIIVILMACMFLMGIGLSLNGCQGVSSALDLFRAENPELRTKAVDEDGDGVTDVFVQTDKQGNVLVDPDTNLPKEVDGTRAALSAAGESDLALGDLLQTVGLLCGVPLAGVAGRFIGRYKPAKRSALLWTHFKGLVGAVQEVRTNGTLSTQGLEALNKALTSLNKQVTGLNPAIDAAKAEMKAARELPE